MSPLDPTDDRVAALLLDGAEIPACPRTHEPVDECDCCELERGTCACIITEAEDGTVGCWLHRREV